MRAVDENAEKGSGELSHGDKGEGNSKDRTVHEELTKRGTQKVPPIAQTVGTQKTLQKETNMEKTQRSKN